MDNRTISRYEYELALGSGGSALSGMVAVCMTSRDDGHGPTHDTIGLIHV